MDVSNLFNTLLTQFGPWAVVCWALWWSFKHTETLEQRHSDEVDKLAEVVNNNTVVLQKLIDRMGGE